MVKGKYEEVKCIDETVLAEANSGVNDGSIAAASSSLASRSDCKYSIGVERLIKSKDENCAGSIDGIFIRYT